MARFDDVRVSRSDLSFRTVLVHDVQPTFLNDPDMAGLAAIGSDDGLHALRPAPARFEGESGGCRSTHSHNVDARLFGRPRLIGRIEITHLKPGHAVSFRLLAG
jgi:hypothetical protein